MKKIILFNQIEEKEDLTGNSSMRGGYKHAVPVVGLPMDQTLAHPVLQVNGAQLLER